MTHPPSPNPYEPPGSDFKQEASAGAFTAPAATRGARWLAIGSGVLFLTTSLSMERIFRWQANNVLRKYGAGHHVETMVAEQMARYGNSMIVTAILASLVVAGGVLARYRPAYGLRLLMLACAAFVGHVVIDIVHNGAVVHVGVIIRGAWWTFLFYMAFRAHRRLAPGQSLPSSTSRTMVRSQQDR